MKRVGVICGGSGSSKFASAISEYSGASGAFDLGFIANVADNYWHHGLYVCPDVDIITHALAGNLDTSKGWGVAADTFTGFEALSRLSGHAEWFKLGDYDAALCLLRTELMKSGSKLSTVTEQFYKSLKIKNKIIPATDDSVMTYIGTSEGIMHLQEYWVEHKAAPKVEQIKYVGLERAKPNPVAISYLSKFAVICPANPVTSILPTIRIKGVQEVLKKSRTVAISPFVGNKPFSGPAAKLMIAIGAEPNSFGVAKLYSSFLKLLLVDVGEDPRIILKINELGIECLRTNTRMKPKSRRSIAREIMNSL